MLKGVQRKRADKYWEYTFKVSYSHPKQIPHTVFTDLLEGMKINLWKN